MKLNKNLVFLGMMGSGKTSIGSMISKKLELEFFDIDHEIEKKTKTTIKNIFDKKGEKFFRKIEEKITLKNLKKKNCVISLGGGAFLNNKIQNEVLTNHSSIWLKWDNKILLNRIKKSKKRPIAYNSSSDQLLNLINERSKIYSRALFKIKCDNLTKSEVVKKIIKEI
tara:strand:+ start:145 stop:648 length:504 start_codon:yes stop_codon:yes gene_type:complete